MEKAERAVVWREKEVRLLSAELGGLQMPRAHWPVHPTSATKDDDIARAKSRRHVLPEPLRFHSFTFDSSCSIACMPRISSIDLRNARRVDKLLPFLLLACRDIPSARSELRWLKEHAKATRQNGIDEKAELLRSVLRRSRNEPLQYILGSEFFGELEIKCRPGVLIPR